MKSRIGHIVLYAASFLLAAFCYSQTGPLQQVDSLLQIRETQQAFEILQKIDSASLAKSKKAKYYFLLANARELNNQSDKSFTNWLLARKQYRELDSLDKVAIINLQIAQSLSSLQDSSLKPQPFMDEYLEYAKDQNEPALLASAYMQLGAIFINSEPEKTIGYFNKALTENLKTNDSLFNAKIHHNLGVLYGEHTPYKDSAFYH